MSGLPEPASLVASRPILIKRLTRLSHMDFEHAISELGNILVAPRKMYRDVYFRRQTKNAWSRDDPALLVLICALVAASGVAWSIVRHSTLFQSIMLCLKMVLWDFLLVAALTSSLLWLCTNTILVVRGTDAKMEWAYAFDLHCNGFVALLGWLYIAQLFLLPVATGHKWIHIFVGNTLYFIAFIQYFYIVYLGLSVLPFLRMTSVFLLPLIPLAIGYIVSLSGGYNVSRYVLQIYFA